MLLHKHKDLDRYFVRVLNNQHVPGYILGLNEGLLTHLTRYIAATCHVNLQFPPALSMAFRKMKLFGT